MSGLAASVEDACGWTGNQVPVVRPQR